MQSILELDQVCGGYSLNKPVLHQLSFQVNKGEMIGLLGLNGAGKSTTMKHILGLMRPQSGHIRIHGQTIDENPHGYRAAYAYVPETPMLYEELTVREHLQFMAMAYGLDKPSAAERSARLLQQFQMEEKAEQFTAHLSKGMRQKLMIMCAFLVEAELYIIDEPFVGLDPLGIRSLLDWMVRMKEAGASLLISSHILSTIEHYCDRFIVLHHGRLIASGDLNQIRQSYNMASNATLEETFYKMVKGGAL